MEAVNIKPALPDGVHEEEHEEGVPADGVHAAKKRKRKPWWDLVPSSAASSHSTWGKADEEKTGSGSGSGSGDHSSRVSWGDDSSSWSGPLGEDSADAEVEDPQGKIIHAAIGITEKLQAEEDKRHEARAQALKERRDLEEQQRPPEYSPGVVGLLEAASETVPFGDVFCQPVIGSRGRRTEVVAAEADYFCQPVIGRRRTSVQGAEESAPVPPNGFCGVEQCGTSSGTCIARVAEHGPIGVFCGYTPPAPPNSPSSSPR